MGNEIKDCYECAKKCENCEFRKRYNDGMEMKKDSGINWAWLILPIAFGFLIYLGYHALDQIKVYQSEKSSFEKDLQEFNDYTNSIEKYMRDNGYIK